jgi:hypothetical protein
MQTPRRKPLPRKEPPSYKPPVREPDMPEANTPGSKKNPEYQLKKKAPNEDNTTNRVKDRDKLAKELEKK